MINICVVNIYTLTSSYCLRLYKTFLNDSRYLKIFLLNKLPIECNARASYNNLKDNQKHKVMSIEILLRGRSSASPSFISYKSLFFFK